jgi:hypothetical protein
MTTAAAGPPSAGWGSPLNSGPFGARCALPHSVAAGSTRLTRLPVPGMDKPPSRYDVTVRVAKDDGHPPDPAAFAAAASKATSSSNASVVSAHTAEEIICVVCVAAPDRLR